MQLLRELRESVHHPGARRVHSACDIGQQQLVVAADEELPTVEVLQLPDVLGDGAGSDIELGRGQYEATQPGAGFERLERIEWGNLARHGGPDVGS